MLLTHSSVRFAYFNPETSTCMLAVEIFYYPEVVSNCIGTDCFTQSTMSVPATEARYHGSIRPLKNGTNGHGQESGSSCAGLPAENSACEPGGTRREGAV